MPLPHPIDQYTPLSETELVHELEIYTSLNSKWLPISRRGVDREERAKAERNFATRNHPLADRTQGPWLVQRGKNRRFGNHRRAPTSFSKSCTLALLGSGLLGLAALRRRRKAKA